MMEKSPETDEQMMNEQNKNGNGSQSDREREDKRWQKRLQAAVNAEKVPAGLRDRIGKSIRRTQ